MRKPTANVPPELKADAKRLRESLKGRPPAEQIVTPAEWADANQMRFLLLVGSMRVTPFRDGGGRGADAVISRCALCPRLAMARCDYLRRVRRGAAERAAWEPE